MTTINQSIEFFKRDFRSNPIRFCVEAYAWLSTFILSIVIMITVPNVPWAICYPMWITGCIGMTWACYTRGSSLGMVGSISFAIIDSIGLYRYLTN